MELNEKDIYEAFDLEFEGAEGAEAAEPQEAEGAEGQELTDPAESMNEEESDIDTLKQDEEDKGEDEDDVGDEAGEDGAASEADKDGTQGGKTAQSRKERARHAAARRKAETEAAVAKARSEAEESARNEIEALLKLSSLKDPKTGKTITTFEELRAAKESFAEKQKTDLLKKTGMSGDDLNKLVSSLPEVREAREAAERARFHSAQTQISRDLAEISKIDPKIKTLEDLASDSRYDVIYERVKGHNDSLLDAYSYAYSDVISNKRLEAAMAAERQKAAGKAHLGRTAPRGNGAVSVPREIAEMYRELNPGISDSEIARHYQKNTK